MLDALNIAGTERVLSYVFPSSLKSVYVMPILKKPVLQAIKMTVRTTDQDYKLIELE